MPVSDKSQAGRRKAVFVLGMHRSGTSALTRALNLLGLRLPDDLLPANHGNRRGYWEPQAMMRLNERMLDRLDRVWFDPKPLVMDVLPADQRAAFIDEAAAFLSDEAHGAKGIVLKDPRVSRLLPVWLEAARAAGLDPSVIVACRNPLEVAASLQARDRMETGHGLQLWVSYMLEAEVNSRGLPRYLVEYEQILDDWRSALAPAVETVGLQDVRDFDTAASEIDAFLDNSDRHHASERPTAALGEGLVDLAALYQLFRNDHVLAGVEAFDAMRGSWHAYWTAQSPGDHASAFLFGLSEGYARKARACLAEADSGKAVDWLQKGIAAYPGTAALHHELGRLYLREKRFEDALPGLRRAAELAPDRGVHHHHLSQALAGAGQLDEAVVAAQSAVDCEPNAPALHNHLGMLIMRSGNLEAARLEFSRAMTLDPAFAGAHHGMSLLLEREDKLSDALAASREAMRLAPDVAVYRKRHDMLAGKLSEG